MSLLTIAHWLAWGIAAALVLFGLAVVLLLVGFFIEDRNG